MSLEFTKIAAEVEAMGLALARRASELGAKIPEALSTWQQIGPADDELREKIRRAGERWPGAIPSEEPVNAVYALPPHPLRADILGADGSQIYPDRHGSALYFLINVGSILYAHGSGSAPACKSSTQVYYEEADLYTDADGLIPSALIDGRRDTAELSELARLAESVNGCPRMALVDNGLMLWLALQLKESQKQLLDETLRAYIDQLDRIQDSGASVAGYVGRPRNANVLALLHLAGLKPEQVTEETVRHSRYLGLTDRALFDHVLPPGGRSATFVNASPVNRDFKARGHQMYFFYLNCGEPGGPEVARVEVPQWVALDPARLDFVHAAIVEQCRVPDGFPYVLVRAHELAVVTSPERRALEELVHGAMLRQGLRPEISQKAQTKQWTGARRQHRL